MERKNRRARPLVPSTAPLTPDFTSKLPATASPATELKFLRDMLAGERRRHASVETVLTRHIGSLERQIEDLRGLLFEKLALKPTEAK